VSSVRDYWALTKPAIVRMCALTAFGGIVLAPGEVGIAQTIAILVGVSLAVAGANAWNMVLERGPDARMARTRRRPLPAGRLAPDRASRFAAILVGLALVELAIVANLLTAALAGLAVVAYVLVYTPLKYKTPLALVIGAVPGAAPPLLGWTAATDRIDAPALVLFAILLVWQIPHFIAIALYRKDEYARAGIRVVPLVRGDAIAKIQAVAWALALVPLTLALVPMGVAGPGYFAAALVLGMGFLAWSWSGLDDRAGARWARGYFLASLVYLPALVIVLVLDAVG
jgi:protoheme IX farnesyltransferase